MARWNPRRRKGGAWTFGSKPGRQSWAVLDVLRVTGEARGALACRASSTTGEKLRGTAPKATARLNSREVFSGDSHAHANHPRTPPKCQILGAKHQCLGMLDLDSQLYYCLGVAWVLGYLGIVTLSVGGVLPA